MSDVWCAKCQDQPHQARRALCKSCEQKQPQPEPDYRPVPRLALGCLSLMLGAGCTLGFFIRGCV